MIDATGLTWGWLISCAVAAGVVLLARTGIAEYCKAKRAAGVPFAPQSSGLSPDEEFAWAQIALHFDGETASDPRETP